MAGYRDDDDGILIPLEQEEEKKGVHGCRCNAYSLGCSLDVLPCCAATSMFSHFGIVLFNSWFADFPVSYLVGLLLIGCVYLMLCLRWHDFALIGLWPYMCTMLLVAIQKALREYEKAIRDGTLGQGAESDEEDLYLAAKEGDENIVAMYVGNIERWRMCVDIPRRVDWSSIVLFLHPCSH